jgi:hypothetical protein
VLPKDSYLWRYHRFAPRSVVELLRFRAATQWGDAAYAFLPTGEDDEVRITFGELDRRACVGNPARDDEFPAREVLN